MHILNTKLDLIKNCFIYKIYIYPSAKVVDIKTIYRNNLQADRLIEARRGDKFPVSIVTV